MANIETDQANDDKDLLELMLSDHASAPEEFRPTARWAEYSAKFVDFLRTEGLRDFRGRRHEKGSAGSVLGQFGALDRNPSTTRAGALPEEMYHAARSSFRGPSAKAIESMPAGKVGSPEGFEVDGIFYTLSWLNYYCRYAFVSSFMDFKDQVIVEVGPGSGKQAEMLKRAHPGLTILLFDLPTQLYVANQYLAKVFENTSEFVGYEHGRKVGSLGEVQTGKINVLPHWRYPILRGQSFDLLWNAASFQEMGPDTAKGYLADGAGARNMFLMHNIKYAGSKVQVGNRGVIDPKVITGHREVYRNEARLAFRPETWIYCDSWWEKK